MYKKIVTAIDLYAEVKPVLDKAVALAKSNNADLEIIYISEPVITGYGMVAGLEHMNTELAIREELYPTIVNLEKSYQLARGTINVIFGSGPVDEIIQYVEKAGADLIVIGSHGRHGLALFLGATANGVLHRAKTDVLSVRIDQ